MKKPFTTVTVVVLAVVAIAHALRLIFALTALAGGSGSHVGKHSRLSGGIRTGDWDLARKSLSGR